MKRFVGAMAILGLFIGANYCAAVSPAAGQERFYIGTYTSASSHGIYQSNLDLENGTLGTTNLAVATGDPSYLALHPKGHYLYGVNESGNAVIAFSIDPPTGKLTRLNQQPSGGAGPCQLVVDDAGNNILVANYTGGSVTVFPIQADGRLGGATAHMQHPGSNPHAHCVTLDQNNHYALVCDLGLDRIFSYRFNSELGTLTTNSVPWTSVPTGSGPRHLAMDPSSRRAYVVCELNSTILGFLYDATNGRLSAFQTISSLPAGWNGQNAAAEIAIHPSGKILYASNRGYNSIAVFAINPDNGALTILQQQSVGQNPRHFAIDPTGTFCFVANQDSDNIVLYAIDSETGKLTPSNAMLRVSKPVFVLPILTQPPQPILELEITPSNALALNIGHALSSLTFQIDHAPFLSPGDNWSVLATGARGQTNFILTNASLREFFRASVLPDK